MNYTPRNRYGNQSRNIDDILKVINSKSEQNIKNLSKEKNILEASLEAKNLERNIVKKKLKIEKFEKEEKQKKINEENEKRSKQIKLSLDKRLEMSLKRKEDSKLKVDMTERILKNYENKDDIKNKFSNKEIEENIPLIEGIGNKVEDYADDSNIDLGYQNIPLRESKNDKYKNQNVKNIIGEVDIHKKV